MQVFQGVHQLQEKWGPLQGSVVTIGNFDGVHWGHRQLIETVQTEAQARGVPSIVYTFDPHPAKVLYPQSGKPRMFDLQDQKEQFESLGIQNLIVENFTIEFSKIAAEDFLHEYLYKPLKPKTLVVGHDFSFGSDRHGNLALLEKFCFTHNIKLIIVPPFQLSGKTISSSQIRQSLLNGDIKQAELFLGRSFYIRGTVVKGHQRGRTIGVPTANIHPEIEFIPRLGVYCTTTMIGNGQYPSITNIGYNPTVENLLHQLKVETHIFDFNAELYGTNLKVVLKKFIRDEKKFSSFEELKQQIAHDIQQARKFFKEETNA